MAFLSLVFIAVLSLHQALSSPILTIPQSSIPTYDVIVVGGGPAGLTAASALGRVRRSALLIDSGDYRNAHTQHMHDVIGNDGTVPSTLRALAREQISVYTSVSMKNGTVTSIVPDNNGSYFTTTDQDGKQYLSKNVIFATGVKDRIPSTPGLSTAWGRGIYWCPWCDGWEHKDKPFATMGPFSAKFVQSTVAMTTLNPNPQMLTNGTYTNETVSQATEALPNWADQVAAYGIGIENRTIAKISRLNGNESDYDDDLLITFPDNATIVRNAILATSFPAKLTSGLPKAMGLKLTEQKGDDEDEGLDVHVVVDGEMETSLDGVYVVGDANSDESENVPHAMWSAKRAVVNIHKALAKEYANALVTSSPLEKRTLYVEESFEDVRRRLPQPTVESHSAEELLEYMMK